MGRRRIDEAKASPPSTSGGRRRVEPESGSVTSDGDSDMRRRRSASLGIIPNRGISRASE